MADAKACAGRVERLRGLMAERGYDAVILRNNPDLRWLTGAERTFDSETAHTVIITADKQWLHTDSRYFNTFVERLGTDSPWIMDEEVISHTAWAAERILEAHARVVALEDTMDLAFYDGLKGELAKKSIACLLPRMHADIAELRLVKDEEELELMAHAQEITDKAFTYICGYIKPGMTEKQVRTELENYMFSQGADGLAFDSIVAAGPNGANPHAMPSDYVIQEGDMIVMDYGASYRDYNSDMTRTVVVGEPSEKQLEVYNTVRAAHEAAAKAMRTGALASDAHKLAAKIIADAGYEGKFTHSLGHGVGIQVHEKPFLAARFEIPLEAGSVATDEPGIYLRGEFGVRLEDFGVITDEGLKPFTKSTHDLVSVGH